VGGYGSTSSVRYLLNRASVQSRPLQTACQKEHTPVTASSGSCGTVAAGTQQLDEISREHLGLIHCQSVGKATIFIMKEWSKNLITIKPYCY